MRENKVLELSKIFALNIIELCKDYKGIVIISNQLLRSGTSIGANIHEANYAQGKADFVSKLKIALKECYESEYWLELLFKSGYINETKYNDLSANAGTIRRMLIASCKTIEGKIKIKS